MPQEKYSEQIFCVVGSGPAGVSASKALLDSGRKVTMIDVGKDFTPLKSRILDSQETQFSQTINSDQKNILYARETAETNTLLNEKLCFGSNHAYDPLIFREKDGGRSIYLNQSCAIGGLGNVWGGAALPFRPQSFSNWPINLGDLEQHYREVLRLTGLAATRDDLEEDYPLYAKSDQPLDISNQVNALLQKLRTNRMLLNASGIQFGRSRIAMQNKDLNNKNCIYCGECMNGCPKQLIFNSRTAVKEFSKNPKFKYISNVILEKFEEKSGYVKLFIRDTDTQLKSHLDVTRVFIACGAINTTNICIESFGWHGTSFALKDSQYFYFPVFQRKLDLLNSRKEIAHTLCEMFLELDLPVGGKIQRSHLQVYRFSDPFRSIALSKNMLLKLLPTKIRDYLFDRTLAIQGYLPSDISPTLNFQLSRNGKRSFFLSNEQYAKETVETIRRLLNGYCSKLNFLPIFKFVVGLGAPGSGSHFGGSLPMRTKPSRFESDLFGRPNKCLRVHCIDASVLPSIESETITLTVMANAHRIASQQLGEHA